MMNIGCSSDEPFEPECEVFHEGNTPKQLQDNCKKNPGHINFHQVSGLKTRDLPLGMRNESILNIIQLHSKLVVNIIVKYTSNDRPDTWLGTDKPYPYIEYRDSARAVRTGTGRVCHIFESIKCPCPCRECDEAEQRREEYWIIQVYTALHVVFDKSEVNKSVCQLFYLDEDKQGVKEIHGWHLFESYRKEVGSDLCCFNCVTHDKELVDCLQVVIEKIKHVPAWTGPPFIISHPHGHCQKITFGKKVQVTKVVKTLEEHQSPTQIFQGKNVICRLPPFPWSKYNHTGSSDPKDYNVSSLDTMTPGTEFVIPLIKVLISNDTEYVYHVDQTKTDVTYTFHPGALLYNKSQRLFFPPEAEFVMRDDRAPIEECGDLRPAPVDDYVKYDIDTCKGSSGASIQTSTGAFNYWVHCGAIDTNWNRSTLNRKNQRLELNQIVNNWYDYLRQTLPQGRRMKCVMV